MTDSPPPPSAPSAPSAPPNSHVSHAPQVHTSSANFRKAKFLEFFPEEDIQLGNIIALLGRKGSGKTTVIKALCHVLSSIVDVVVVISPTAIGNEFHHFIPITCIHDKFNADWLENLIDYQTRKWEENTGKEVLVILDDCAFDNTMFKCEAFRKLFFNCRWAHITVIIASQSALNMPTYLRDQIDITISSCYRSERAQMQLYDNYFSVFDRFTDFKRTMMKIAQKRHMLVTINSFSETNDVANNVFWYKAPYPVPDFKMGNPELWTFNDTHHNEQRAEQEYIRRRKKEIEKEIQNSKQPLYEIMKDTTRKRIPENTLRAKTKKRKIVYDANPTTIQPKAMANLKSYGPTYSLPTARAFHANPERAYKRMKRKYGNSY